ncbi:hypothetical protein BB737_00535 [Mycobacterium avium subsp. hominissuis]|uniref:hypothetical protein n=1 Tax=Mycobacterium avium TaxID=1764 RepID=UPI0005C8A4D5|nr:hypothetical protein [Mycobacterium avium]APA74600.1 hypothetical protein KV38_04145 [Mycobacterium avium subsp. hominissuis]ATO61567.2 hypothetical protein BEP52_04040 [Mycobacterium avium subsp. hominissuis]ATO66119.1 hypothetical protein BJP78_03925 [Mycobacterium avium subsp. hominissuis]ATO70705.1 hypothetical protein BJP74_04010 [Mycobacterium avium subsp. hominissuis]PBJ41755.1 hypothetical protein BI294_04390 [Mycobacterium avium subsp. hominissuis]
MRVVGAIASATLMTASATILGFCAPVQASSDDDPALNGKYRATSDGQWAQTNDQFHSEPTVTAIWTITSTCSTPLECSGQVTSDQGWTAPLKLVGGSIWVVAHDVPNWEQCGDGMPAATGRQIFRFATSDNLRGDDKTTGPSGACGVNKWLTIDMPFKLEKID